MTCSGEGSSLPVSLRRGLDIGQAETTISRSPLLGIPHFKQNSSGECVIGRGFGAGRARQGGGCCGRTSTSLGTGPGPELTKGSAVSWQYDPTASPLLFLDLCFPYSKNEEVGLAVP